MTSSANATFSNTVLFGSSLKSWNTQPMLRRRYGTRQLRMVVRSSSATKMRPCVGFTSRMSMRMKVDLPEPECPTKKMNSPA